MFWFAKSDSPVFSQCTVRDSDSPVFETGWSKISRTFGETRKTMTVGPDDWRTPLIHYLEKLSHIYGLLLKCLGSNQSKIAMGDVHEGICDTHESAHKIKWLLRRAGCYWPTMLNDGFRYYRGCESCQKFGDVQLAPTAILHPIIKPWPFRGWTLDFVGQIHPASSKGHRFVLVTTDYFTKWAEVIPLKNMVHREVIQFILEHIIHRFGIPHTLTMDHGSSFMSHQVHDFVESLKMKLLSSLPYYAQANG
jgi:hypothetical protein